MGMRLLLTLLWLLRFVPARLLEALAWTLAQVVRRTGAARTARINLQLCFPGLDSAARMRLEQAYFTAVVRSALELGTVWFAPLATICRRVRIEGMEHHAAVAEGPVILLAMHSVGLEMAGARLGQAFRGVGFFTPHKNAVLDGVVRRARDRLGDTLMLERSAGLRPVVRAIRDGRRLYFLPDQDFGEGEGIFAPFFGIPAATVTTLPRLVTLTGARVLPVEVVQEPGGHYCITLRPAWTGFPSGDLAADTARMNAFVEDFARRHPDQYFWGHKRFRTRPEPGAPSPYERTPPPSSLQA